MVGLLTACASQPRFVTYGPAGTDPAEIQLAEAATSISHSLDKLAAVRAAEAPPATKQHLVQPTGYTMAGKASVDWSGPIGGLVKQIADASEYKLRVLGNAPSVPIIVSINAQNVNLGDVLRDADFQAGDAAHIRVYQQSKTIELRYRHG